MNSHRTLQSDEGGKLLSSSVGRERKGQGGLAGIAGKLLNYNSKQGNAGSARRVQESKLVIDEPEGSKAQEKDRRDESWDRRSDYSVEVDDKPVARNEKSKQTAKFPRYRDGIPDGNQKYYLVSDFKYMKELKNNPNENSSSGGRQRLHA